MNEEIKEVVDQDATEKPALRIVTSPEPKESPGKNNPFVKFMTAYADAIDAEVKTILQL